VSTTPESRAEAPAGLREGWLRYREDVVDGLENAPAAPARLPSGENGGKQLVRLGPGPHATEERTDTR
jgi:NADPH-dependent curcumin reductase CurA